MDRNPDQNGCLETAMRLFFGMLVLVGAWLMSKQSIRR